MIDRCSGKNLTLLIIWQKKGGEIKMVKNYERNIFCRRDTTIIEEK